MPKPTLVIDGDIILYQAAQGAEEEVEWEPDQWTVNSDLGKAKQAVDYSIKDLLFRLDLDDAIVALSDPNANFRKQLYPDYKGTRKGTRKPVGYKALYAWCMDAYPSASKPGLEGDDVMGILATQPDRDVILWSLDKDMATIPGRFMRGADMINVTPAAADWWWMCQTMAGDPVDNYPGCKGIGLKTAEKIMPFTEDFDVLTAWKTKVLPAFLKAGYDEAYAITQARLARILRWDDWDIEKQEPILWTP